MQICLASYPFFPFITKYNTHTHTHACIYSAFCGVHWMIKVFDYTIKSISQTYCSLRFIKHTNSNLVKTIFKKDNIQHV
jgi:hypothetical protein